MTYWVHSDPEQPAGDDGQRPCARDRHCSERDHKGQPKPGPRAFCSTDELIIGRSLAWLPTAYVELHMRLGEKASGQGEKVTMSSTPSIPLNLNIDTLLTDMVGLLESWAERVREVAQLYRLSTEETRWQRDGVTVEAAVKTLSAEGRISVLLGLPPEPMTRNPEMYDGDPVPALSGADAGLDILDLHSRARSMLGLNPKHEHVPIPCWNPDCEMRTVIRWDGQAGLENEAHCTSCGQTYTHDRYQLLMGEVYAQQQAKTGKKAS